MQDYAAHIALIIFMNIIAFIGICGNILTITFYSRKTRLIATFVMIKNLALVDGLVCFIAIITLLEYIVNIIVKHDSLCKTLYFFIHWFVLSSVFILCAIAIDRYRKMCKPRGWQFTNQSAFWTVLVLLTISMIIAMHDFATYKVVQFNIIIHNETFTYLHCTNTDEETLLYVVLFFHVLDACTILASFVTFVVTYGSICHTLRKYNKAKFAIKENSGSNSNQTRGVNVETMNVLPPSQRNNPSATPDQLNKTPHNDSTNNEDTSIAKDDGITMQNLASDSTIEIIETTTKKVPMTIKTERQLTVMMFAITVAFCVCFIPYFIVIIYDLPIKTKNLLHLRNVSWKRFAVLSPYFNSVVNPFIFCVFNSRYRHFVKKTFTRYCKQF